MKAEHANTARIKKPNMKKVGLIGTKLEPACIAV
ncbi:MAG: hypothetical protein ACJA09_000950 [Alcanivorax sp.]|jgi:hypothetical protein